MKENKLKIFTHAITHVLLVIHKSLGLGLI